MFYKHWKKFALALTALFWAGCDDSASSSEVVLYGCPDDICAPAPKSSSDANGAQSSSSDPSTSSGTEPESSSSVDWSSSSFSAVYAPPTVFCTPMDSSVSYFPNNFSADNAKFWKEEAAKHDAVAKIDSVKETLAETPMCLEHLRMELDQFVALYGAPTIIRNAVEKCIDGTIRPSEEYAKFLKMQEEWEANKSALDEELKKVYEDKMKEIEERINKCLNDDL
ncbi:MAG: hypothetical protein J6P30_01300 [Fibrobacter sp.]|nr:hypothetical protein [Fibrobacter sp.]